MSRLPALNSERDFELDEITIDGAQKAFQSGQYSSRSLTEKYLQRIGEIDKAGPMVNSVIESTLMLSRSRARSTESARRRGRVDRCMAFRFLSRTISIPATA